MRSLRRWPLSLFGALLVFMAAGACSNATSVTLTVSAASDLTYAFQELGKLFEEETGVKTTFNFGSTGQLAQQIERGASVDVFAAANLSFVDQLETEGLIIPGSKAVYARGFIVLWTRQDYPVVVERLEDLARPEVRRVAIANPDHAPYGMAAREALQASGVWEQVKPKLVVGENVRQVLQYAEMGNVDVAVIALSLATVTENGRWTLIPQELHTPLDQVLAVVKTTQHEKEARAFASFINGPKGRPVMQRYGFVLPGESPSR